MLRNPIVVAALILMFHPGCSSTEKLVESDPITTPDQSTRPPASRDIDVGEVLETLVARIESKANSALQEALVACRQEGVVLSFGPLKNGTVVPVGHVRAIRTAITSSEARADFEVFVRMRVEVGVGSWKRKFGAVQTTQIWRASARPVVGADGTIKVRTEIRCVSTDEKKERQARTSEMERLRDEMKNRIVQETQRFVGEKSLDELAELLNMQ